MIKIWDKHDAVYKGTFISAFTVLCGARSDLISERGKCCVFWLNVAAALIQILTAVIMVGWIMSIFWGMDMVILASQYLQSVAPILVGVAYDQMPSLLLHFFTSIPPTCSVSNDGSTIHPPTASSCLVLYLMIVPI
ncbi:hypothetical protein WMY93_015896 [Mugilogobius chulae]|uniref:Uncharacterized protein n=1 Tax=Mugilogobius chulae TaxID=88201 RepID=A0AAW0NW16_9GOBI